MSLDINHDMYVYFFEDETWLNKILEQPTIEIIILMKNKEFLITILHNKNLIFQTFYCLDE